LRFVNKVALITGGGSGIGRATALLFAQEGAKVAINDKSNSGQDVANEIKSLGSQSIFIQGGVEDPISAERMVAETIKAFGRLDILFNNAGILVPGRVDNISLEDWERTMAVNVRGVFLVSRYAIEHLRKQGGGVIVNTASSIWEKGGKNRSAYATSKGAVVTLTKSMAADYASDNIRVNCVVPGAIDTKFLNQRLLELGGFEEGRKALAAANPLGRIGRPEDIASGVLYLASDEASWVTGIALKITGG
jgi:NAD(P)-dependent dehydrogenase (short-subunit alcohol dehydrogenase family)